MMISITLARVPELSSHDRYWYYFKPGLKSERVLKSPCCCHAHTNRTATSGIITTMIHNHSLPAMTTSLNFDCESSYPYLTSRIAIVSSLDICIACLMESFPEHRNRLVKHRHCVGSIHKVSSAHMMISITLVRVPELSSHDGLGFIFRV